MTSLPAPGSPAPGFSAPVTGGDFAENTTVSLTDLQGKIVVLYFYPKDDTPGCTAQACALRDGWTEISALAAVFGISPDAPASHAKFARKHSLPFPLLSDTGHAIAEAYGVWVEKKLYGKTYMGTARTTFVIGPDGVVKSVLANVKPDAHFDQLLAALRG